MEGSASRHVLSVNVPSPSPPPVSSGGGSGSSLSTGVIIGISIGVLIGVFIAGCIVLCFGCRKKRLQKNGSLSRSLGLPIRVNGVDSSTIMSDSISSPPSYSTGKVSSWFAQERNLIPSSSGVTKFSYK